jgi:hypothetical protein
MIDKVVASDGRVFSDDETDETCKGKGDVGEWIFFA